MELLSRVIAEAELKLTCGSVQSLILNSVVSFLSHEV